MSDLLPINPDLLDKTDTARNKRIMLQRGDSVEIIDFSKLADDLQLNANEFDFKTITLADPAPTRGGFYFPTQIGTYARFGNIEIIESDLNSAFTFIVFDGFSFSKSVKTLGIGEAFGVAPLDGNKKIPNENLEFGTVTEGNLNVVSGDEVYNALIPNYYENVGYINYYTGAFVNNSNYRHTFFLKIQDRNNLIVTGYSGGTENVVALVSFYDSNLNYLSRYNTNETANVVNQLIPESEIPSDAVYVRCSKRYGQVANVLGVFLDNSLISYEPLALNNVFTNSGYIHKVSGYKITDSGYVFTVFLKLLNRNSLVVRGFSGTSNNVSLVSFYDKDFNYIASHNSATSGTVTNYLVPESEIPINTMYLIISKGATDPITSITSVEVPKFTSEEINKLTNLTLQGTKEEMYPSDNIGYIDKDTGLIGESNGYLFSQYLTVSNPSNLTVTGYSGVTNKVALVSFFDKDFKYLGFYNAATHGSVTYHEVPESAILIGTKYIRVTMQSGGIQVAYVSGAYRAYGLDIQTIQEIAKYTMLLNKASFSTLNNDSIFIDGGYVHKENGLVQNQETYSYTIALQITDKNNLRITGFSGVNNNVALAAFYNSNFNFIGYYNATTIGNVTNHLIPSSSIPDEAVYVKFTKRTVQPFLITGVKTTYYVDDLVQDIEKALQASSKYMTRSGKPNVDKGGFLKLQNYLGNTQNIHPKVLFFENGWNGFNYWMAYTPYPGGQVQHENPCIAASVDGMAWITPNGLDNPLEFRPTTEDRPSAYNSDTHLVYNNDTNELECWWRSYDPTAAQNCIKRRVSSNGIDWQPTEIIFNYGDSPQESQAVIYENGIYRYWACNAGKVIYTESADVFDFPAFTIVPIDFEGSGIYAWHMDVINTPKGLEFAIQCWEVGKGNNNTCDLYYVLYDGSTYSIPRIIVERGDLPTDDDYQGIYRASILWHPFTTTTPIMGGTYYVYYTGIGKNYSRRALYLTSARDIDKLRGVNL